MSTPQPSNATLQFVNSAYSPGGAAYSNPNSNAYNSGGSNLNTNNTFQTPQGTYYFQPSSQQQQQPSGVNSLIKSAGQYASNGFTSNATNAANIFGAQNFGLSAGNVGAISAGGATESISPALAAADPSLLSSGAGAVEGSLSTASLSGILGATGIGALAGNFLGKIGGNSTGGSIGGGIGAGIGMAIGGPPGAIVGGLIGGIGGGFFGGNAKPTAASEGSYKFNADGSVTYAGGGEKNPGPYSGFNQQLGNMLSSSFDNTKQYLTGLGLDLKPLDFRGGVNTLHSGTGQPGFLQVAGQNIGFDPSNQDSINKAIGQAMSAVAKNSGATDAQVKQIASQIESTQNDSGMPNVPLSQGQFSDFMNKYKVQGSNNAQS